MTRDDDGRSPRERILLAAVDLFGRRGFAVGLREVADRADVSLGLIRHHFGSKDGLRAAGDRHVLDVIRETKRAQLLAEDPAAAMLDQLATLDDLAPVWRYLVAAVRDGGELARRFVDDLVADTEQSMRQATERGVVRPSRDPSARARFLAVSMLGGAVLHAAIDESSDAQVGLRRWSALATGPALELYTQGLLTNDAMDRAWASDPDLPHQGEPEGAS